MRALPPIIKVCQNPDCGKTYTCDKRWGKAKREKSKTCSVECQRKWLGLNQTGSTRGTWQIKRPRIKKKALKLKEKVVEPIPKPTFQEFKEGLLRRAKQRKITYE